MPSGPARAAAPPTGGRRPGRDAANGEAAEARAAARSARQVGSGLALAFLAVGVLLLVLAVAGRGWPYLLGAVDFLVIGGVLLWASRHGGPAPTG